MSDMTVSWALSTEQVYSELDRLEAEVQASAQRQAEMITAANLQMEAAAAARQAQQMAASSAIRQAFDADITRSIARSQEMAGRGTGWMVDANRSLTRSLTQVGNVGNAAFIGIGASIAIANRGLDEYAKRNSQVAQEAERIGAAKNNLLADIGRDISPLMTDAAKGIDAVRSVRSSLSDTLGGLYRFGGQFVSYAAGGEGFADGGVDKVNEAQKLIELQDIEVKRRMEANREDRKYRIETAEQEGRTVEAERLRGLQRREQVAAGFAKDMTVNDRRDALDRVDQQTERAIELARKKEAQAKADDEAQRQRARMQISDDERGLSISLKRLQGKKLEADLDELGERANKKMAEIRDNDKLTPEEKRAAQMKLAEQFDATRRAMIAQTSLEESKAADEKKQTLETQRSQFDLELESYRISLVRMDGHRKEADLLELQLQTRKRISDIEKSDLSPEEKEARIKRLRALSDREAGFIESRSETLGQSRTTVLQGGALNAATLERLVFNASGRENQSDRMINLSKEQVTLLKRIANAAEKEQLVVV